MLSIIKVPGYLKMLTSSNKLVNIHILFEKVPYGIYAFSTIFNHFQTIF
jgi:hypothetical protein